MDNQNATQNQQPRKNSWLVTGLLIAAIAVIAIFPMFFNFGDPASEEQFGGTDSIASDVIMENDPNYTPWFEPLVGELPGEVESGLFALQAGLGAGVLGYAIGFYRGKNRSGNSGNKAETSAASVAGATGAASSK
nr:energy-coupling factor ABC transporter substrate-binding protein [Corynebacterium lactis]